MVQITSKIVRSAAVASLALAAFSTGASADYKDQVYIGSTGVANPLVNPQNVLLTGKVVATCLADSKELGGYSGSVTTSTTKGNPGGGQCTTDYQVSGSVRIENGSEVQCTPKIVERPDGGWNGNIHYAHFGAVSVNGQTITCAMDGQ